MAEYGPATTKDDRRAEIVRRRCCHSEERFDEVIEGGHAPSRTVNIRCDPNAQRGSKDVVRRCPCGGKEERPTPIDRSGCRRYEEGNDRVHHHQGPWR
jgi:hypothetical protein